MAAPDELAAVAARVAGDDAVHVGSTAIGAVVPTIVVAPKSVAAVSETLRWAHGRRLAVVPTGAGTKLEWGGVPPRIDLLLSLGRLDAVVAHRHGDLTATVQAGASLGRVNELLRRHGQWLPLDPAHAERATIGGIVATNDAGPRRHRHGAPRDLILGVSFVRADGAVATAGGIVVKNVAGYDLSRLLAGSFGALGVVVEATFKLVPAPPDSRTIVSTRVDPETIARAIDAVTASQLAPSALEVQGPPFALLARFETVQEASERQGDDVVALWSRCGLADTRVLTGAAETGCWTAHHDEVWERDGDVCRIGLLPTEWAGFLEEFAGLLQRHGIEGQLAGRVETGALHARIGTDAAVSRAIIDRLRARVEPRGGHVALLRGSPALRAQIEPWGTMGDATRVMDAVKRQFDPEGILSPGRWPRADERA
jgi:glycolate oxidase FAD binding subunit